MSQPVYICQDPNFTGTCAGLDYGSYYSVHNTTGVGNDSITAIRVKPFTKVTVYKDANYTGDQTTIIGPKEIPDLRNYAGGFNDEISSIQVVRQDPDISFQAACCSGEQTGDQCGEYQPGTATCTASMAKYCSYSNNISDPKCKRFCSDNSAACDSAVIAYCSTHAGDPYCSCINSKANDPRYGVNPLCIDSACIATGYATTNMKRTPCPTVINCDVKNTLVNSGVVVSQSIPVTQNCGNNTGGPTNPQGTVTTTYQPPPTVNAPSVGVLQNMKAFMGAHIILMLMLLFVIIIAIVISAVVLMGDDDDGSEQ